MTKLAKDLKPFTYVEAKVPFYPAGERARVVVDQWLFWQMANLGPKAGEANHFATYAVAERQHYALERFDKELHRLFGVMNTRLKGRRCSAACICGSMRRVRWTFTIRPCVRCYSVSAPVDRAISSCAPRFRDRRTGRGSPQS